MRTDERELMSPWMDVFPRLYGSSPIVRPLHLDGAATASVGDLFTLSVPNTLARPELLGRTGHFRHMPRMVAHVRRLGYDWDPSGMLTTLPTPSTLNAMLDALVGPTTGYRTKLRRDDRGVMPVAPWLRLYLAGLVPIHVASAEFYAQLESGEDREPKSLVESLLHDLTVHALNYHLVPQACITDLRARITEALPERVARLSEPGATGPITLSYFFDNDFNRYCYAVWCRTEEPSSFAPIFCETANYAQLLAALAIRIEETRRGLGEIPSEDATEGNLRPLTPVSFSIP